MIVNIRGTHGSGKTTIVRTIIERYRAVPIMSGGKKPKGYVVNVPWLGKPLHVVGSYHNVCGGCDGVPYTDIWPRVTEFAELGHVLFEGALISNCYGNVGQASETFGNEFIFAFLNTPLNVCLARIVARRKAKGNEKPLNPKSTADKHRNVDKIMAKMRDDEFGRRVVVVDYRKAVSQTLGLFNSAN